MLPYFPPHPPPVACSLAVWCNVPWRRYVSPIINCRCPHRLNQRNPRKRPLSPRFHHPPARSPPSPSSLNHEHAGCTELLLSVCLYQWFGLACVGVLVEDSVKQLLYMFILHAVDLAVLVTASPFANR